MNIRVELTPADMPECETLAELGAHRDLVHDALREMYPMAEVTVVVRMASDRRRGAQTTVWGVEDSVDVMRSVDVLLGQVAS
jgi:hypothetical protein